MTNIRDRLKGEKEPAIEKDKLAQSSILEALKIHKKLPTYRLAALAGLFYYDGLELLEEMAKQGTIIKIQETKAIYWRLPYQRNNDLQEFKAN